MPVPITFTSQFGKSMGILTFPSRRDQKRGELLLEVQGFTGNSIYSNNKTVVCDNTGSIKTFFHDQITSVLWELWATFTLSRNI